MIAGVSSTAPTLQVRELVFAYRGQEPVVNGLNEDFRPGEVVALTGPSGTGKSTLLYLLGLMLRPQRGEIRVNGEELANVRDSIRATARASSYGFVFQDAILDPGRTVLANVLEPAVYRGDRKEEMIPKARGLLARFGVEARADHKPGEISGGQAQRIAVCRALLTDPLLLLADEPTGNLDVASARVVIEAMRSQAERGAVVVVATHDDAVIASTDREVRL
jgi:ABC-type lipoprotein export system ATPase subunit